MFLWANWEVPLMIEIQEARIDFGNAIIDADFSKIGSFLASTRYYQCYIFVCMKAFVQPPCNSIVLSTHPISEIVSFSECSIL